MSGNCKACKNLCCAMQGTDWTPNPAIKCFGWMPQTNYDIIVSKTPYELAEWIAKILDHCENKMPDELCRQSCPLYKCCNDQPSDNIEDWLKSPVEEVDT